MKKSGKKPLPPKTLTAVQTSRHFRMSHHRHTGRVLPRTSTSYPTLVMIVLCVGVLLGGWTHVATAQTGTPTTGSEDPYGPAQSSSYVVHGSVPAPAPTVKATIDDPVDGRHVSARPIIVSGSCPIDADGGYVSIYRNDFYSGTALCDATGHYQLSIDLFAGANKLVARDFNFTDVAGPDSAAVTVYYDAPTTPATSSTSSGQAASNTAPTSKPGSQGFSVSSLPSGTAVAPAVPLSLSTTFAIRGYYVDQQSIWQLDLEGGTGPYAIATDWGDGSNGIVSRGSTGELRLTHTYVKPGGYQGSYIVKFTATDAAGNQTYLQLLVVVNSRQPAVVGRISQSSGTGSGIIGEGTLQFLHHYVWPSYGVVVLMLSSFWLGERREFRYLRPRLKHSRHA